MDTMYIWLIAGVLLTLAELHFTGLGFFFAGLGAITTGALIYHETLADVAYIEQFVTFIIATALWTLVLWKPLQHFRRPATGYNNIVGETAFVGSNGLTKSKGGEVTWSGTIMKAQLAKNVPLPHLEAGSQVTIVEVRGATLIVKPKE